MSGGVSAGRRLVLVFALFHWLDPRTRQRKGRAGLVVAAAVIARLVGVECPCPRCGRMGSARPLAAGVIAVLGVRYPAGCRLPAYGPFARIADHVSRRLAMAAAGSARAGRKRRGGAVPWVPV